MRVVQEPKPYRRNFHAGISPQASVVGDDRQAVEVGRFQFCLLI